MIKAIFLDVDGTLLSHTTGSIPDSARKGLRAARERGILLFVSTGRHPMELRNYAFSDICLDGYVALNGQLVLNGNGQLLCSAPFSKETTSALAAIFFEKSMPMILVEEKRIYINLVNELVCRVQAEISSAVPEILEYTGDRIYQASTFLQRGEEYLLEKRLPRGSKMVRWSNGGVDIIPKDGGKVAGIKKILERYHISREEIMAFGDAENDMEMLAYAKIGVAMGNATANVKDVADYVTDHIDHDGIMKALAHFEIIDR